MNRYDRHILPYLIDFACGLPMVQAQRRRLVPQAQGRVLEIGMGTGRNLAFYDRPPKRGHEPRGAFAVCCGLMAP